MCIVHNQLIDDFISFLQFQSTYKSNINRIESMWFEGVTLFCRHNTYSDTWSNSEMLFIGVSATPTHFQCNVKKSQ